jgi:membrane associated rhomboid family serine protease
VVTALPELILMAADAGIVGSLRWRQLAYQNGAFWVGLLDDWQPNYPAQPVAMFATYSLLHTGFQHMAGNLLALVWLGRIALDRVGPWVLLEIYAGAALAGAIAFALMTDATTPMVGASGAIFGLAGAWVVWDWQDSTTRGDTGALVTALRMVAILAALNVAIWLLQDQQLAWETHLGGFLAGAALAIWTSPRG